MTVRWQESQSAERLSYVGDVAPRLAFLLTIVQNLRHVARIIDSAFRKSDPETRRLWHKPESIVLQRALVGISVGGATELRFSL